MFGLINRLCHRATTGTFSHRCSLRNSHMIIQKTQNENADTCHSDGLCHGSCVSNCHHVCVTTLPHCHGLAVSLRLTWPKLVFSLDEHLSLSAPSSLVFCENVGPRNSTETRPNARLCSPALDKPRVVQEFERTIKWSCLYNFRSPTYNSFS